MSKDWHDISSAMSEDLRVAFKQYLEELETYVDSRIDLEVDPGRSFDEDAKRRMLATLYNLLILVKKS